MQTEHFCNIAARRAYTPQHRMLHIFMASRLRPEWQRMKFSLIRDGASSSGGERENLYRIGKQHRAQQSSDQTECADWLLINSENFKIVECSTWLMKETWKMSLQVRPRQVCSGFSYHVPTGCQSTTISNLNYMYAGTLLFLIGISTLAALWLFDLELANIYLYSEARCVTSYKSNQITLIILKCDFSMLARSPFDRLFFNFHFDDLIWRVFFSRTKSFICVWLAWHFEHFSLLAALGVSRVCGSSLARRRGDQTWKNFKPEMWTQLFD